MFLSVYVKMIEDVVQNKLFAFLDVPLCDSFGQMLLKITTLLGPVSSMNIACSNICVFLFNQSVIFFFFYILPKASLKHSSFYCLKSYQHATGKNAVNIHSTVTRSFLTETQKQKYKINVLNLCTYFTAERFFQVFVTINIQGLCLVIQ